MRIVIICEGKTEKVFLPVLRQFLETRLVGKMPKLIADKHDGAIPSGQKLRKTVHTFLNDGHSPADIVIALTDVYPKFPNADDAKRQLREWVGNEERFHPHVALHDFEAWLLPYWDRIQKLAVRNAQPFGSEPEKINHGNPPAHRLHKLFEAGKCRDSYQKPRDATRILKDADLMIAIQACPELKAFMNSIISQCDSTQIIA